MLISLNLIKHYTNIELDNDELIKRFWSRVAEVEDVINLGERYERIVIGVIKEASVHPDADKLGLYQVDVGTKTVQVVAGDKTLQVGDRVAYIAPGVAVPSSIGEGDPFIIKKVELRGKESVGMLASGREIGFNDDHKYAIKLDTDATAGTLLSDIYDLDDTIIEVDNKSFVHRPDCFGLLGVAREISGIQDLKFRSPDWYLEENFNQAPDNTLNLDVKNEIPEQAPRYMVAALHGIEVKPSPIKLQSYLKRLNIKPINNMVDITNFVMIMTGQPLHVFDYDKVTALSKGANPVLIVRNPKKGERLALLNGKTIEPHEKAILICTDKEPIDLGGAMGGATTEVDSTTKRIILESANFDLYNIRKTMMVHGVFTEAVTRFIRGQSPVLCGPVLGYAMKMINENCGAKLGSKVYDIYPKKQTERKIQTSSEFISKRLGFGHTSDDIKQTLDNIEIKTVTKGDEVVSTPPYWRRDLNIAEDLVEEVGRINGFDHVGATYPNRTIKPIRQSNLQSLKQSIRYDLASAGANEVLTFNFVSSKMINNFGLDAKNLYHIRNSLSPELEYMRANLLPSLVEHVHSNIKAGHDAFALYEINKGHSKSEVDKDKLPIERNLVAVVVAASDSYQKANFSGSAYYQAKVYLDCLLKKLGVGEVSYKTLGGSLPTRFNDIKGTFIAERSAVVLSGKTPIAIIGEFSDKVMTSQKLPVYCAGFEFDLDACLEINSTVSGYKPLSKFPKVSQDATYQVSSEADHQSLELKIKDAIESKTILATVELKDIYQKEKNTKNMTYHITMQSKDSTLTTEQSNELIAQATSALARDFKAKQI